MGEVELTSVVGGIWRRICSTLLMKKDRKSSHFSVVGSSWWVVGGFVIELITENRVLGLLPFLVMMLE